MHRLMYTYFDPGSHQLVAMFPCRGSSTDWLWPVILMSLLGSLSRHLRYRPSEKTRSPID